MKLVYEIENLDCPNCAAKIEQRIAKLGGVQDVSLSYTSGKLYLTAASEEGLLERLQAAADAVEDGVVFRKKGDGKQHAPVPHACHDHDHEVHHHAHAKKAKGGEHRRELLVLGLGVVLFVIGMVLELALGLEIAGIILFVLAYLVMGYEVLLTSLKSIGKGQIFDENFLMAIATIGAMCVGCWEEAAGVMLFFRLGELFEHVAVERSRRSITAAIDLRPETAIRVTASGTEEIPAQAVAVGDVLLVRAGERIPVDGEVIKGESTLDTSAVTGESVPLEVSVGTPVMSGCINVSGVLELRATAALEDSLVSRILDSVESAAAGKPKIDRFITRFARVYTPIVVAVAILTAIIPSLFTGEWRHWIYTALNFLMISCPCALVLSVPLAFFAGIGTASRQGILFKDGAAMEVLSKVKVVAMDKTGTLTKGEFSVERIDAVGCTAAELVQYCAACEAVSTHPIAKGILAHAAAQGLPIPQALDVQEVAGKGLRGVVNGKQILCGKAALLEEGGVAMPHTETSGTMVYAAADGQYLGALTLSDTPKETSARTVQEMNRRGLHTVMLTGDHAAQAEKMAAMLAVSEVHAGLLPTEKPAMLEALRKAHGAVLFVGDGMNDAPVLSGADVGAAMGSGADAAMEAADIVYLRSEPEAILTSMKLADRVNRVARINIIFALAVKFAIMLLGFAGFANMWLSVFADTGVTILCVLFVLLRLQWTKKI